MTSLQALLILAVGGALWALLFFALASKADEKDNHDLSRGLATLAVFGFATCLVSLLKAAASAFGL